ncbi:hypothetical protein NECID01_2102 [Nematocida sp. AWRm77]|nr:hypothetical protein NECID01_2102 [Nematocida sp. AWRm77]
MDSSTDNDVFQIDEAQERKYNARESAKELRELEEKYKNDSLSDTETSGEYEDNEEENRVLQDLIHKIRNKDPEIYTNKTYFTPETEETAGTSKEKSFRLKEYYRKQTLDQMHNAKKLQTQLEYNTEQAANIEEFAQEMANMPVEESLFVPKKETEEPSPEETPEEFLANYVLAGRWAKEAEPATDVCLEEDSEELEMIEEFEKEVYESSNKLGVKGKYVTTKAPEQKRRRKELRKKMRNREEEKKKEEEIKRMKNLKKQQLSERLSALKSISGLSNRKLAKINLNDAYNEKEFNKMIDSLFDEKYFEKEENKRPKIKGDTVEAQELQDIEEMADKAMLGRDQKVKGLLSEIKDLGKEYTSLGATEKFEYIEGPTVNLNMSVLDILLAEDSELKRKYPLKKLAPYQTLPEKQRMEQSLQRSVRKEQEKKQEQARK